MKALILTAMAVFIIGCSAEDTPTQSRTETPQRLDQMAEIIYLKAQVVNDKTYVVMDVNDGQQVHRDEISGNFPICGDEMNEWIKQTLEQYE